MARPGVQGPSTRGREIRGPVPAAANPGAAGQEVLIPDRSDLGFSFSKGSANAWRDSLVFRPEIPVHLLAGAPPWESRLSRHESVAEEERHEHVKPLDGIQLV